MYARYKRCPHCRSRMIYVSFKKTSSASVWRTGYQCTKCSFWISIGRRNPYVERIKRREKEKP